MILCYREGRSFTAEVYAKREEERKMMKEEVESSTVESKKEL